MESRRKALISQLYEVFPLTTDISNYFLSDGLRGVSYSSLANRVVGKSWTEVDINLWSDDGYIVLNARESLTPEAFHYYAPSIILRALDKDERFDVLSHLLLPDNKLHVSKGEWWPKFRDRFSREQRIHIADVLNYFYQYFLEEMGEWFDSSAERSEIQIALDLWLVDRDSDAS